MAKLTKIVAGVLIVAGVSFSAAKGYAYWRVKSQLDDLARVVSPFAELRWSGISTGLDGSVEVDGLTIAPLQIPQDIAIASVRIETGDPRFLFTGLPTRPNQAPEQLRVAVQGMRVPLKGALLEGLQAGAGAGAPCGPASLPGPAVLAEMGMESVELDIGAELQAPKGEGRMRVQLDYATRGVDEMTATVNLGGVDRGMPQLQTATMRYQPNAETYGRMIEHCARRQGSDRATYLGRLASSSDALFLERFGVAPGPGLREAISRYLQQPGEVKVVLRPTTELLLNPAAGHSPEYWIEATGLELYVNGQLVEDLSVIVPKPQDEADGEAGEAGNEGARSRRASFQERPLAEIGGYLDYRVRVHTRDGKPPREGRLKNVDAQHADIDQRLSGGHLVAHVRLEQITRLEVYTR